MNPQDALARPAKSVRLHGQRSMVRTAAHRQACTLASAGPTGQDAGRGSDTNTTWKPRQGTGPCQHHLPEGVGVRGQAVPVPGPPDTPTHVTAARTWATWRVAEVGRNTRHTLCRSAGSLCCHPRARTLACTHAHTRVRTHLHICTHTLTCTHMAPLISEGAPLTSS